MRSGDALELADGKGNLCQATFTTIDERKAGFQITGKHYIPKRSFSIHLAIAPTKNIDRMEWLVEKVTEIGLEKITFVRCKTSERPSVPLERLQKLAISAMKQSRQAWLPELVEMTPFRDFIERVNEPQRFIAYVDSTNPDQLLKMVKSVGDRVLLIGPEGDFTNEELEIALNGGFIKVNLGPTRLRTETAGLVGVVLIGIR